MAEEWGLVGGIALILAFMLLLRWGLQVALRSQDKFSRMTAAGLTTTIFFYIAVNLMMVMGLAPVVGIPLPFMSYGGSSMLTIMMRSEEHTSELQSLMRNSYAVFCLKKKQLLIHISYPVSCLKKKKTSTNILNLTYRYRTPSV